jgi:hypothetical protein
LPELSKSLTQDKTTVRAQQVYDPSCSSGGSLGAPLLLLAAEHSMHGMLPVPAVARQQLLPTPQLPQLPQLLLLPLLLLFLLPLLLPVLLMVLLLLVLLPLLLLTSLPSMKAVLPLKGRDCTGTAVGSISTPSTRQPGTRHTAAKPQHQRQQMAAAAVAGIAKLKLSVTAAAAAAAATRHTRGWLCCTQLSVRVLLTLGNATATTMAHCYSAYLRHL